MILRAHTRRPRAPRRAQIPLFVYGSLLTGEPNHGLLAGARRLGEARTAPAYTLVDLGHYPALVADGATRVAGELYAVTPQMLAALDHFEGHPHLYQRNLVRLEDGREVDAYLFEEVRAAGFPCIPSGSWRAHQAYRHEVRPDAG
jgi:gamma-glutamylcyclotransferase (GGCT)/AIG2-like uncharacterized protein YtfP